MLNETVMKIYDFLKEREAMPQPYGSFHLMWMGIVCAAALLLLLIFRNAKDKASRVLIFLLWAVMFTLEVGKQLSCSLYISGGEVSWHYAWHAFPFQFCSTPLYILPLFVFLKDGKARDAVIVFLSTYAFVGGLTVYLSPDTVFTASAYTNMQTMVHHGIQLISGLYIGFKYHDKLNLGNFARGTALFLGLASVAFFLDVTLFEVFGKRMNLFFISPYNRYIPNILKGIGLESIPYPVFLCGFIVIFISLSLFIMAVERILVRVTRYE